MPYRDLQSLKSSFNVTVDLWRDTAEGEFFAKDTPAANRYYSGVYRLVGQAMTQRIDDLASFALSADEPVSLRRSAVEFLVREGLESPRADDSMKNTAFIALQRVFDAGKFVCFPADIIPRIAAAPIATSGFYSELLGRQKSRLMASLENRPAPRYPRALRAPAPPQQRLFPAEA